VYFHELFGRMRKWIFVGVLCFVDGLFVFFFVSFFVGGLVARGIRPWGTAPHPAGDRPPDPLKG